MFHQTDRFNQGFLLVGQNLLTLLDLVTQQHNTDGEGVFTGFEQFLEGIKNANIEDLAIICRELLEATNAKRILAPIIDGSMFNVKSQIKAEYCKLVKKFSTNPKRRTIEKDVTKIIDECIRNIDECCAINPTVLPRSEAVMIMKKKVECSLVEFDYLCRKHYGAILGDVHKK